MASNNRPSLFRKQIAFPQDHGSWVFILSPLIIGLFAGNQISIGSIVLVISVLAGFLIRQPITILIKIYSKRRNPRDLPAAVFWSLLYASTGIIAIIFLIYLGYGFVLYLAIPGIPVFIWHLYLVSKRAERRQAGIEIMACGVLSLAAPAAYWVGINAYDPLGWWLFIFSWLQSAASIVYAYLRLAQRDLESMPTRSESWKMARRALEYTSFNLVFTTILSVFAEFPPLLPLPYALQWLETIWGTTHPAIGVKPARIGVRQLIVSTLFTILFIVVWQV
jgi:hypothetical protein